MLFSLVQGDKVFIKYSLLLLIIIVIEDFFYISCNFFNQSQHVCLLAEPDLCNLTMIESLAQFADFYSYRFEYGSPKISMPKWALVKLNMLNKLKRISLST
ncbi:unnamed protein product [Spodoptera littoralis]|uniref:Uncharacterized protein n=1 Tax=Spodoptera littoralis TaxID=7109 RepID=A0A9P0I2R6_SPOLI|nr:unnamed protein product [Spodoptera littoralis]CAH1640226.1 unnamed protein product [Spodoptera littoralis]